MPPSTPKTKTRPDHSPLPHPISCFVAKTHRVIDESGALEKGRYPAQEQAGLNIGFRNLRRDLLNLGLASLLPSLSLSSLVLELWHIIILKNN